MPPPRPAWRGSTYPAWGRVGHPGSPPRRTRTHAGHRVLAFGQSRCKKGTPRGTGVTWDGKGRPSAAVVLPGPSSIAASHRRPRQRREVGRTQRTRCRWVTPSVTHPPPPLKELRQAPAPRGAPRWVCPLGSGQGSDTVHPGGRADREIRARWGCCWHRSCQAWLAPGMPRAQDGDNGTCSIS